MLVLVTGVRWAQAAQDDKSDTEMESPVSGDNPGIINVTSTASPLSVITEQMITVAFPRDAVQIALPNLLTRVGLLDWLEVRAILPSAVLTFPRGTNTQIDVDQLSVGAALARSFHPRLSGSLVPMLTVPIIAGDGVGAPGVEGQLQGNLSWSIAEQWTLAGAARAGWVQQRLSADEIEARFAWRSGLLIQYSPVPTLALFMQGYVDHVADSAVEPSAGGGASYWITPSIYLFAETSAGITDDSAPIQLALGAVVRWW